MVDRRHRYVLPLSTGHSSINTAATGSSETSVPIYRTTLLHTSRDKITELHAVTSTDQRLFEGTAVRVILLGSEK
jgi:hypothetical protein